MEAAKVAAGWEVGSEAAAAAVVETVAEAAEAEAMAPVASELAAVAGRPKHQKFARQRGATRRGSAGGQPECTTSGWFPPSNYGAQHSGRSGQQCQWTRSADGTVIRVASGAPAHARRACTAVEVTLS